MFSINYKISASHKDIYPNSLNLIGSKLFKIQSLECNIIGIRPIFIFVKLLTRGLEIHNIASYTNVSINTFYKLNFSILLH